MPYVKSVRKDDIIRQRHLLDGFFKAQDTSTFAIANPECPIRHIRRDKESNHFCVREIRYQSTSDSYLTSKAV